MFGEDVMGIRNKECRKEMNRLGRKLRTWRKSRREDECEGKTIRRKY